MSAAFLITSLVVIATPGTGALYTISAGLTRGTKASLIAALASTLGVIPHVIAAITGAAALLNASATAFQTLKYLGVAYLLYMAWRMYRDKEPLETQDTPPQSAWRVIGSGIAMNLLNPKLTIFFFAFLPQFVQTDQPHAYLRMIELSAVFVLMTFVVFVGYGAFAAAFRQHVLKRPRVVTWLRRSFAGAFVALSARLALTDR